MVSEAMHSYQRQYFDQGGVAQGQLYIDQQSKPKTLPALRKPLLEAVIQVGVVSRCTLLRNRSVGPLSKSQVLRMGLGLARNRLDLRMSSKSVWLK
jgi:hypothetical protein